MVASAPCSRHTASFSSLDAAAMTLAPSALPISMAASPTPPAAPSTSMVSPGCSAARSTTAWCEVPYVSVTAAPVSKSIPGGIGITACAGTSACWANAPLDVKAMTLSPTAGVVTPSPTARTTPDNSLPGVNGNSGLNWYLPWMISTSGKLTPAALTSMATWPGPGTRSAPSSTTRVSGRPQVLHTTAFMLSPPVDFFGLLEPGVLHIQRRRVELRQQVQLRSRLRQFPLVEIAAGLQLALVEIGLAAAVGWAGQCLLQPQPRHHHVADRFQVQAGVGQGAVHVAGAVQRLGHRHHALPGRVQLRRVAAQVGRGHVAGTRHGRADFLAQRGEQGAILDRHLPAQQVQAVDAMRAFVDGVQAVVAVELLDIVFTRVAIAAVDLDGQAVRFQAPLGGPGFRDRRQDVEQPVRLQARRLVGRGALLVDQPGRVQ